ncbi:M42 family metallopeptidase [Effusibacillus pohliae]|uniref:M42 family metallopeptidase n=1 Tax=Effusibacillus pohliae TaxID=232270 RepID=UPI00037B05DE|nr:M42 family metallopeptidase [Effusibacillus pohliae]
MSRLADYKQALLELMEVPGVTGYESEVAGRIASYFCTYTDEIRTDKLGNLIALIRGEGAEPRPRIMVAAHMDEIGLIVTKVEPGGFLRFTQLGGLDPRTLLGQEVIVHGRTKCHGIVGSKPPHLTTAEERDTAIPLQDLYIDLGMPEERVREQIQIGDVITIVRSSMELQNGYIAGKALDNRAGIAALLECLQEMNRLWIQADVYVVATVQEELGNRGAAAVANAIRPDLGIAVDVTHAGMPGVAADLGMKMDGGAVIHNGPNIHRDIFARFVKTADQQNIPYQIRLSQAPTATDGNAIQITREGIPTGVLAIPLRYMHTSVETVCYRDVQRVGKLLAHFVASVDRSFVEGLACYLKN